MKEFPREYHATLTSVKHKIKLIPNEDDDTASETYSYTRFTDLSICEYMIKSFQLFILAEEPGTKPVT
jgi:hypothetical protein